jgi:hypothetical protein
MNGILLMVAWLTMGLRLEIVQRRARQDQYYLGLCTHRKCPTCLLETVHGICQLQELWQD